MGYEWMASKGKAHGVTASHDLDFRHLLSENFAMGTGWVCREMKLRPATCSRQASESSSRSSLHWRLALTHDDENHLEGALSTFCKLLEVSGQA